MLKFMLNLIGWLVPILGIVFLLSELVAIATGILLLVTLSWQELLSSMEVQVRLLLAVGLMTLGVGQFALISFLLGPFSQSDELLEEERPVFVLPPSEFSTHGGRRRRRHK
jgi:hypothetical protein